MRKAIKILFSIMLISFSFSTFSFADSIPHPVCSVSKSIAAPNDQIVFTPSMPSSTDKFIYRWVGEASTTSTGAIGLAFIYPGDYTVALYAIPSNGAVYSGLCPKVTISLDAASSPIDGGFYPYPFASSTLKSQIPNEIMPPPSSCLNLGQNLFFGYYDNTKVKTDGVIYKLQQFLKAFGYLRASPSGYFGNLTKAAVQALQRDKSIDPTGFVGPLTRANIKITSCSPL
jgi:hypothetical protein